MLTPIVEGLVAGAPASFNPLRLIRFVLETVAVNAFEVQFDYLLRRRAVVQSDEGLRERETRRHSILSEAITRGFVQRGIEQSEMIATTALVLGALTTWGQELLPDALRSAANSAGSWSLVAFLLAWPASGRIRAALCGAVSLWALLLGYVLFNEVAGASSSPSMVLFWAVAGLIAGPVLGASAFQARQGPGPWSVGGVSVISGVLLGEGLYGLTVIADTTSPVYWWVQIGVGVVLGAVIARLRRWTVRYATVAVLLTAVAAAAFRFGYAAVGHLI